MKKIILNEYNNDPKEEEEQEYTPNVEQKKG